MFHVRLIILRLLVLVVVETAADVQSEGNGTKAILLSHSSLVNLTLKPNLLHFQKTPFKATFTTLLVLHLINVQGAPVSGSSASAPGTVTVPTPFTSSATNATDTVAGRRNADVFSVTKAVAPGAKSATLGVIDTTIFTANVAVPAAGSDAHQVTQGQGSVVDTAGKTTQDVKAVNGDAKNLAGTQISSKVNDVVSGQGAVDTTRQATHQTTDEATSSNKASNSA
ncbi:hypothetical protein V5O48_000672 [Marasmius crinis-equi]|uniref:Uncharacterized protein n=1 Tax=Marasmius crinis-equi TaxID=585013 RepID=A0ABR3G0S2_9AGAR